MIDRILTRASRELDREPCAPLVAFWLAVSVAGSILTINKTRRMMRQQAKIER